MSLMALKQQVAEDLGTNRPTLRQWAINPQAKGTAPAPMAWRG
jgi:hypothetical protein